MPCPCVVESSGYSTRVSDSASRVSPSAPTKSPVPNFLKIEVFRRRRGPEPKRIDRLSSIAHHGTIKRNTDQARWPVRDNLKITRLATGMRQFSLISTFS